MENKAKKAMIVTAKTNLPYEAFVKQGFILIGVERGALDLIEKKLPMDLAVGDWDKVLNEELSLIKSKAEKFISLDEQKDYFDGEYAVKEAQKMGCSEIYFVANATKRYDKNFSIFHLIWDNDLVFINDSTNMFVIKKGVTKIPFERYQGYTFISFISRTDSLVTINDMVYNVKDFALKPFATNCLSNAFIPYLNPIIETNNDLICIMSR